VKSASPSHAASSPSVCCNRRDIIKGHAGSIEEHDIHRDCAVEVMDDGIRKMSRSSRRSSCRIHAGMEVAAATTG
jgi:hypothetical protein